MPAAPPVLRRLALAVAVLHDVDLLPLDDGILLPGLRDIRIGWSVISAVTSNASKTQQGQADPAEDEAAQREALAEWLLARRALEPTADGRPAGDCLSVVGMPATHPLHPGARWIRERVPGGALTLGFGYGAGHRIVPAGVLEHAGIDTAHAWSVARSELEEIGATAAERDRRHTSGVLTPVRGTDVVTLLGSASLRGELAASVNDGLAALIVPLRTRGWRANSITDPAYGPALAAAMSLEERGFLRPLLVTAEELTEVRAGGDPMRQLRAEQTHPA